MNTKQTRIISPVTLEQYNTIRDYCSKHKWELLKNATPSKENGNKPISVADQVANALRLPYSHELVDSVRSATWDW